MSRVLVDRELLDRAVSIPTKESLEANQAAIIDRGRAQSDIRELLAQPAEAEGVQRYCFDQTGCDVADNDGPWVSYDDHLAALSAVTAERDGLVAARTAYASEFAPDKNGDPDVGSVHANIRALKSERDQLRAEVEALRKDAERYRWLAKRDRWASLLVDFDRNSTYRRHRVVFFAGDDWPQFEGQTIDEAVDAAMAAKEA